jgi:hypothetical protein
MPKKLIWFAMSASVFVYAGLIYFFENYAPIADKNNPDADMLFYMLGFIAFLSFIFQFGVSRLPIPDELTKSIVRYALLESVSVLGLVAYILTGYYEMSFIFLGLGLLGLIIVSPFSENKTL